MKEIRRRLSKLEKQSKPKRTKVLLIPPVYPGDTDEEAIERYLAQLDMTKFRGSKIIIFPMDAALVDKTFLPEKHDEEPC